MELFAQTKASEMRELLKKKAPALYLKVVARTERIKKEIDDKLSILRDQYIQAKKLNNTKRMQIIEDEAKLLKQELESYS